MKIYIHHFYSRSLFLKFFALTTNKISKIQNNNTGVINCTYKNLDLELIFNPELNDNDDGYHLIDFLAINYQIYDWHEYSEIKCVNSYKDQTAHRAGGPFGVNDIPIMKWIADKLKDRKGWLVSLMRTEKNFIESDGINFPLVKDLESEIKRLKNHIIFSDNFFIEKNIESIHYPNHNFIFTNTIFQWNEHLSIRWYYEFKNIFDKINPPYKLCFSMRNHKLNRIRIIELLSRLQNKDIFLSRSNHCNNSDYKAYKHIIENLEGIHLNEYGNDNFDDINYISNIEHYLEYIMRILPMAKMHILTETWDYLKEPYASNYLSEKTYGFVLSNIPFISTHTYPYDILREITGVENHPFYKEAEHYRGVESRFSDFVNEFMKDYENNYELCKNWVNEVHTKVMYKIYNENSFLDLMIDGFKQNKKSVGRTLI
jgi:hypothetical protein